jgi:predicted double-glycine peptidase
VIWLAVQLLGSAFTTTAGVLAAKRSRLLATGLVGIMVPLLVLKVIVALVPAGEARLFPWNWYPVVEHWWYLFPAMLVLGAAIVICYGSLWKRDAILIIAALLVIQCGIVAILMGRPHELTGRVNLKGVCHQTSGYSCSAASAVNLLHRYGVGATEREMAELCVTRAGGSRWTGTTDSGLMRGLRIKLEGRGTPRITLPAYDSIPTPSLVAIQLNEQLSHSIMVVAVAPDHVNVVDPLYGTGTIPREQFERGWKKSAIHLEVR